MSEETTQAIADSMKLEQDLTGCLKTKTVQLVNNLTPIQPGDWIGIGVTPDPNDTCDSHPHIDTIREKLRAKVRDLSADPADRAAAKESLRIMYRETN